MAVDTAGQMSTPTRQRAEVDWNRAATGPRHPRLGRATFLFVAAPPPLGAASGVPVNPLAIF